MNWDLWIQLIDGMMIRLYLLKTGMFMSARWKMRISKVMGKSYSRMERFLKETLIKIGQLDEAE